MSASQPSPSPCRPSHIHLDISNGYRSKTPQAGGDPCLALALRLPPELYPRIIAHLDPPALARCLRVDREFYALASRKLYQTVQLYTPLRAHPLSYLLPLPGEKELEMRKWYEGAKGTEAERWWVDVPAAVPPSEEEWGWDPPESKGEDASKSKGRLAQAIKGALGRMGRMGKGDDLNAPKAPGAAGQGDLSASASTDQQPDGSASASATTPRVELPNRFKHTRTLIIYFHHQGFCSALPSDFSLDMPRLETLIVRPHAPSHEPSLCTDPPRPEFATRACTLLRNLTPTRVVLGNGKTGVAEFNGIPWDALPSVREVVLYIGNDSGLYFGDTPPVHPLKTVPSSVETLSLVLWPTFDPEDTPGVGRDAQGRAVREGERRWTFRRVAAMEGDVGLGVLYYALGPGVTGRAGRVVVVGLKTVEGARTGPGVKGAKEAVRKAMGEALKDVGWGAEEERKKRVQEVEFGELAAYVREVKERRGERARDELGSLWSVA